MIYKLDFTALSILVPLRNGTLRQTSRETAKKCVGGWALDFPLMFYFSMDHPLEGVGKYRIIGPGPTITRKHYIKHTQRTDRNAKKSTAFTESQYIKVL